MIICAILLTLYMCGKIGMYVKYFMGIQNIIRYVLAVVPKSQ